MADCLRRLRGQSGALWLAPLPYTYDSRTDYHDNPTHTRRRLNSDLHFPLQSTLMATRVTYIFNLALGVLGFWGFGVMGQLALQ